MLFSCSHEPEAINFGHDECALCKMTITDEKYGSEIVTKKGRFYKFDALECMAKYILEGNIDTNDTHSIWTVDYKNPQKLIDAKSAVYLRSKTLPSPMAMFFTSFSNMDELETIKKEHEGDVLNWYDVKKIVKNEWH
jgi:copper chaperone NosL